MRTYLAGIVLLSVMTVSARASQLSIGTNGIDSFGLTRSDGVTELTGDGITLGQVEPGRPGKSTMPPGDMPANSNATAIPAGVFIQDMAAAADTLTDPHAQRVLGVMISSDATDPNMDMDTPHGVAINADVYASADDGTGPDFDPESAISAQHIASFGPRAVNMSFANPLVDGHILNGNQLFTQFVDWSASQHNILYVVAGNQVGEMNSVPTDNYNGLTIAASERVGGTGMYHKVWEDNRYDQDAVGDRSSISLLAPGDEIELANPGGGHEINEGTSYAAPHVTGTVALLQEYGEERITNAPGTQWNANARQHEVMKAVLINSADKLEDSGDGLRLGMTRTVLDQGDDNWLNSVAYADDTIPLDIQMGAGHLNARRALQQFATGEHNPNGAAVPMIGWDYGTTIEEDDINRYTLSAPLAAGQFVSLTLAWDREVLFDTDGGTSDEYDIGDTFIEDLPFNDLDLFLMPAGETDINEYAARSIASDSTVEHIFFEIESPGSYEIWVRQFSSALGFGQDYALAWWTQAIPGIVDGDYDGNGSVGPEDYAVWKSSYGDAGGPADGNGDGIVDAVDYTVWRNNVSAGSGGVGFAHVPEPSGFLAMIASIGSSILVRRRRLPG
jgi:hypothetical protein